MAESPVRIDPRRGPWPLHGALASRQTEALALVGAAPHALMAAAGLAAARWALALAPHAQQVQVWCGPGNNGGDGLVLARHLHLAERRVQVLLFADPARLPTDAVDALHQARQAGVPIVAGLQDRPADLVIDALLGLGASRAPAGAMAEAIAAVNRAPAPVLALDLPSGLNPDTGMPLGADAVRAQATLSLLTLKPGCFTGHGRDHAGEVWLDRLGVPGGPPTAWLSGMPTLSARAHAAHKGRHGDVLVVGGAPGMVGAAWLAGAAALAAGAGRVHCDFLDQAATVPLSSQPALMHRPGMGQLPASALAGVTVACGCGGGEAVRAVLPALLSNAARLVLDADALNAIAGDAGLQGQLQGRAGRGHATLLTPHPLEAARLLQQGSAQVQGDRLEAATRLAERFACAVLLKGSGSVIAEPGRLPHINPTGNAALATAGSGDVLAGWAAGLWAQAPSSPAGAVAIAAAWQHGRAADLWPAAAQGAPLRAQDLVEALARRDCA